MRLAVRGTQAEGSQGSFLGSGPGQVTGEREEGVGDW